jgi:hypothetical protein
MGERTKLTAVQRDGHWAVRIIWPNESESHYGKFPDEREAKAWLEAHQWMTAEQALPPELVRHPGRRKPAAPPSGDSP